MGQNNFVIRVVEPGDTPVVPNTGLFGQNINGIATAILTPILILISISVLALFIKKLKKAKVKQLLNHNFKRHFKTLLSKRSIITSLSILAIVAASATFIALKNNSNQDQVNAEGGELSITTESVTIEVELGDEPVYAEASSTITVNTATPAGYTLSAYVSNQELQPNGPIEGGKGGDDSSSAPSSSSIDCEDPEYSEYSDFCEESGDNGSSSAIDNETNGETSDNAVDEIDAVPVYSTSLKPNTWGIALADPGDESSTTFRGLPDKADDALVIKVAGTATEAGDTTEVYYGAYITPDLPAGEYVTTVNYVAVANVAPVVPSDITVKYHGNGLTFPEGISDPNTMIYGYEQSNCAMSYLGDYCTTLYKAKNSVQTETLSSIKENYDIEAEPGVSYIKYITIPDADSTQVVIDYKTSASMVAVIKGKWDGQSPPTDYKIAYPGEGQEIATIYDNTITIYTEIGSDDDEATLNFYPVYSKAPAGIETEEFSVCNIAKSDNVNDEGEQQGPYTPTYDEDGYNGHLYQKISVPGADKVKVDLRYGVTSGDNGVIVVDGRWDFQDNPEKMEEFTGHDGNIAGTATITFDTDGAWFVYLFDEDSTPETGYDYGFYARVYPIYNEDHENTIPIKTCSVGEELVAKSGTYAETTTWKGYWALKDNDGNVVERFYDREDVEEYVKENEDTLAGTTVDLEAYNPYSISYNANVPGQDVPGPAMKEIGESIGTFSARLGGLGYERNGYAFIGWSLDPNAEVNNPNYTIYGPNQTVTQDDITVSDFKDDGGKTATLYAVWVPTSGELQNWSNCNSLNTNQVIALTDNRDGRTYTVAKLLDGKCWMTENLRTDNKATITAENTDNPAPGFTLPAPSSYGWCDDAIECVDQPKVNNSDTHGHYYNFYAATAGTGGTSLDAFGHAEGSICPIGWKFITGEDISSLREAVGGPMGMRYYPNNFTYDGIFMKNPYGGNSWVKYGEDRYGFYWGNNVWGANETYEFQLDDDDWSGFRVTKFNGHSVRCVQNL